MPPVSTTPAVPLAKFASGVVDTSGKFATGVVDNGGAPGLENISKMTLMLFSGAWGKMIREKNLKEKLS